MTNPFLLASLILTTTCLFAAQPKELGNVKWLRNYDEAIQLSSKNDTPILILFQEVPGCQGCIDYGQTTLTHPLIVDAVEEAFVPLAIHNNKAGHDLKVLERFGEPAWNFQVMRFLNAEGDDLIPRKDQVWTPAATAIRMAEALRAAGKAVPDYLNALAWSDRMSETRTAVFSMSCFWDGEAKLGAIEGVVETEAGWLDGHEVVRLRYDPKTIQWPELVEQAQAHGCGRTVYAPDTATLAQTPKGASSKLFIAKNYRSARQSDQKRHLQFSKLKSLPLNPVQRTKINAALSQGDSRMIQKWLGPSQIKKL
ncbi:MAG TPA: hypothetical protein DCX06_04800 [Opitutae bacterium]|nr:hypothetical protein [Opitutae bacterium]